MISTTSVMTPGLVNNNSAPIYNRRENTIFWRKIWTSFLLSLYSFCSSEEAAIGDIDGGDKRRGLV
jgi:hypothetical protein